MNCSDLITELIASYKAQNEQIKEIIKSDSIYCNFSSIKDCVYRHQELLEDFLKCDLQTFINNFIISCQGFSEYWEIEEHIKSKQSEISGVGTEKYLLGIYDIMLDTYCHIDRFWESLVTGGYGGEEAYQTFRKELRIMRLAFEEDILIIKSHRTFKRKNEKKIKVITKRIEELNKELILN